MPSSPPVRIDQDAHRLLRELAEETGRTQRDLASEAIKAKAGRDLREEVSEQVGRLEELTAGLGECLEELQELTAVRDDLQEARNGMQQDVRDTKLLVEQLQTLTGRFEKGLELTAKKIRGGQ